MASIRRVYWVLIILLAVPFLAVGARGMQYQGGGPGGGGRRGPMSPDDRLAQMTKDFNLTTDQQAKIKPILADQQKKMDDLRSDSSGDRQSMLSKMMQIQQDTNTQIRNVLDDKQKDLFDKQQQERQQRMRRGPGGPSGQGGYGGDNPPPPPPQN